MNIVIKGTLAAAVADTGTFTATVPMNAASPNLAAFQAQFPVTTGQFYGAQGHQLTINGNPITHVDDFTVALTNQSTVTVTNRSGSTWPAGASFVLELDSRGQRPYQDNDPHFARRLMKMSACGLYLINLGKPLTLDEDGICAAQAVAGAANLSINGALASGGAVYLDVPRAVMVDSSSASDTAVVITVYGKDVYGQSMAESITCNGTTAVSGLKAFSTVTRVASSGAAVGNINVGTTDKLGLPAFVPSAGFVIKEILDGAAATAGTFAYGMTTAGGSTATTGDVRGTYLPNSASDGSRVWELLVALPDPGDIGRAQFAG
jgi:hypothetical protein